MYITAFMFAIIVGIMICQLFDLPLSVTFRRFLGALLLIFFILWVFFGSGMFTIGGVSLHSH
jgi:hypothetical protein